MSSNAPAPATLAMASIDCPDAAVLSAFYRDLLGWQTAYESDGYAMLKGDGTALGFGSTPDYTAPAWPDEGIKQFHLDLGAENVEATVARCVQLGATKPDFQPGEGRWTVLIDPAGHPFCVTNLANWG